VSHVFQSKDLEKLERRR